MREIVLDTETTGLSSKEGHRITEIGCVELINHLPTGRVFHSYINPERDISEGAAAISGLTNGFLKDFPIFSTIVDDFLSFVQDSKLVIHNASFDLEFLNSELQRLERNLIPSNQAIDTLVIAKKKFPGSFVSLDALCKRFNIDLSKREKHGALIDAELLAEVYLELLGGRQHSFSIKTNNKKSLALVPILFPKRTFDIPEEEKIKHLSFLKNLKNPLWDKIRGVS